MFNSNRVLTQDVKVSMTDLKQSLFIKEAAALKAQSQVVNKSDVQLNIGSMPTYEARMARIASGHQAHADTTYSVNVDHVSEIM